MNIYIDYKEVHFSYYKKYYPSHFLVTNFPILFVPGD